MLKSSNEDVYKVPYNMMLKSGIWPKENPTLVYKIKTFLSWFFAIGLLVVQLMQAINDIKDFAKLSETLYIMVAVLGYIIKLGVFTYRKEKFLEMVNFLKRPIFTSYPDDYDHFMKKNIKYASLAANTLKYFFMSCVVLYLVFPIIDQVPLPFPFPYDLGRYTFVMYAFQIAAEGYAAWNNACIDTLCTCMMGVAVAQLEILSEKIIHIKKDLAQLETYEISEEKEKLAVRRIRQCVQHHLAIMRYIEYVEGIFGLGIFLQFTISALVICNTLFHFLLIMVSAQFLLLIDYFVSMLIELFIYCWFGNEIIIKSREVGDACYECSWYTSSNKLRKYVFVIMERSKRPLRITSMKFVTLSLAAFASILQWSYSCLALLMKMYDKRSA